MKEKPTRELKNTEWFKENVFSALAILLQAVFMVYMFTRLNEYAAAINTTTSVLAIILVLGLYNREQTASMTTPWIILILAFPIMGVSLYLLVGLNGAPNKMRARFEEVDSMLLPCLPENADILSDMYEKVPQAAGISTYLAKNALYPVYQNTDVTYYDQASKGLEAQQRFIKGQEIYFYGVSRHRGQGIVAPYPEGAHGARAGWSRGKGVL